MSKTDRVINELSAEARSEIAGKAVSRIGAVLNWHSAVTQELRNAGIIGPSGGLTVTGSGVAARLQEERERELFG